MEGAIDCMWATEALGGAGLGVMALSGAGVFSVPSCYRGY